MNKKILTEVSRGSMTLRNKHIYRALNIFKTIKILHSDQNFTYQASRKFKYIYAKRLKKVDITVAMYATSCILRMLLSVFLYY